MSLKFHYEGMLSVVDGNHLLLVGQHTNTVIVALVGLAILLATVPFKFMIMGIILQSFMASKPGKSSGTGNRRLKEWWDSIPVIPVRLVDTKIPNTDE